MAIIQVWTGPRCQSGAEPLGPVAHIQSGRVTEAVSGAQGPVLTIPRAVADTINLRAGAWLWISHPRRGTSEWPILSVTTGDGRARDTVTVQGGTIRQAIALRGGIRRVNRFGAVTKTFTPGALTPSELLAQFFFQNLAADNLAWVVPGTIEYEATIALGTIASWTRGQLLDAIERATGFRFVFTRIGDSAYQLDLRNPTTTTAPVLLTPGVTVDSVERTEDLVSSATVAEPIGGDGAALGETWWQVAAITGTGPYWVALRDPASGRAVLGEDDQVNGWFLRPNDGLPVAITDSRVSDSAVEVATVEGLVVGGLAALWLTADGAFPAEVPSPAGIALRGRVVQEVPVAVPSMGANRITDGALRNALASWEVVNPSAGGVDVLSRTDPVTVALLANGAASSGASSVAVDGGPANGIVRRGDAITVSGTNVTGNANVTTSATGTATVALTGTLPTTLAGGTVLAWGRGGAEIGTVTTNGTQSAGASSLSLQGLTATPQLTNGDTLVKSTAPTVTISNSTNWRNDSAFTIAGGTAIVFVESWLVQVQVPVGLITVPTFVVQQVTYSGTTVGSTAPGAVVSFTSSGPTLPPGAVALGAVGTMTLPPVVSTWTLNATPTAWNGDARTTATITGTLGQALNAGEVLRWLRAGVAVGEVRLTANAGSGASSLSLENPNATRLLTGDTFSLQSQTIYAGAEVVLSSAGAGTITLRVNLAAGIADNAAMTIQRPRDLAGDQFGGPTVLRLRGNATAAPATYRGGTDHGIYSPIIRVQSPDPTVSGGQYSVRWSILTTGWGAEPSQMARAYYAIWDVDTQAQLSAGPILNITAPYTPLFNVSTHADLTSSLLLNFTTPRRLRMSLHGGSGQSSNLGGYAFLRGVALTVYPSASPGATAALVDGAFGNQSWHRGNDLLDSTRNSARYRVSLGSVAPLADDPAQLLTVGGSVRLRSGVLGVDQPFRVSRLVWSLRDDDAVELELATATPRLTESA